MSGLQITVTTAGRNAMVNAENTGTAPVRIAQIGVTAQAVTPDAGMSVLPGERKRLSTFAGAVVADDTVHVTIRDDSTDAYSLRGFALYLADGTLLALYSQPDIILEKSAQAMLLLAADIRFVQVDATSLTFGDTNWINPPATTTVPGVVELATYSEAIAATDTQRALSPAAAKAALDDRFGAGAPSGFVKSLLPLATATLIRTALELGNAALRNEGAGNGLDADKLDGQHGAYYLEWANLTGKPATFTPSAHAHLWADLSNPPATATRWPGWAEVTDKPATFTPSVHTHAAADITSGTLADARIAQANVTQHQAALSIGWGQITGKPGTFAPSAHTHDGAEITGRMGYNGKIITDWNATIDNGWYMAAGAANAPNGQWLIGEVVQHNDGWVTQTLWEFAANHRVIWRRQKSNGAWLAWERCRIHENDLDERYFKNSGGIVSGDITAYRPAAPATGVIFLGNSGARYLFWDGGNYQFGSAGSAWHSGNFDPATKANAAHAHAIDDVINLPAHLNAKANLSGAGFSGAVSAPSFQVTSSRRLKTEIAPLERDAGALIDALTPVRFRYRTGDARPHLGLIAEDVQAIVPEVVGLDEADQPATIDYGQLVPVLIAAVQSERRARQALEARVAALEARQE